MDFSASVLRDNTDNRDYLFYYGCPPLSVLSFKKSVMSLLSSKNQYEAPVIVVRISCS